MRKRIGWGNGFHFAVLGLIYCGFTAGPCGAPEPIRAVSGDPYFDTLRRNRRESEANGEYD